MDLKIQDYFSLGYIYLLVLGIFKDVIYYSFLGVNILEYSSVADVLLSPIIYLGKSPILFFGFCLAVLFILILPILQKNKKDKNPTATDPDASSVATSSTNILPPQILLLAIGMFTFFIGIGLGSGYTRGKQLDKQELKLRDTIIFASGQEKQVRILGKNSNYVFYWEENAEAVAVAPITGNVRKIVKGKKVKEKK